MNIENRIMLKYRLNEHPLMNTIKIRTNDNYTGLTLRHYIIVHKDLFKMSELDVNVERKQGVKRDRYVYNVILKTTLSKKSIEKLLLDKRYIKFKDNCIKFLKSIKETTRPINTIEEMDTYLIEQLETYEKL